MKIFFDKLKSTDIDEKKSYLEVKENGTVLWHQFENDDDEGEVFEIVSEGVIII